MLEASTNARHSVRRQRDAGYLLLAIMLMMAFMVITITYVVGPKMVQQMKRDREEEMIRRGTEYARAIKKFYKRNGRYPASLDDLDKGQIRFLRKRYKDPLTKDGKWKLLNYGDIQSLLNTTGPGVPAASLASQGGALSAGGLTSAGSASPSNAGSLFQQQQSQQPGSVTSGFNSNSDQGSNQEGVPTNNAGSSGFVSSGSQSNFGSSGFGNSQSGFGGNQPGNGSSGQSGTTFGQNSAGGNQTFGGGAIVGVASLSKDPTIRIYNKKKTYDQWVFIYNPIMDQANVLLRGPYQPTTIGGNTNIGTPASQLNGQQQQNGFGQQGAFGQQNSGFGQQGGFGQQNSPQTYQPGTSSSPQSNQP